MANSIAWGFQNLTDLFAQRISAVDYSIIRTALTEFAQFQTETTNALFAEMARNTVEFKERVLLPASHEMQPLPEDGTPDPQHGGAYIETAYPMRRAGFSFGMNREVRAKMTVGELNEKVIEAEGADTRWILRAMLAALYTNANYTFKDPDKGDLTVRSLAKAADGSVYINQSGNMATATHHIAQAAGIADATNPYTTLYNLLSAHPSNRRPFVAYIPTNLVASTMLLASFVEYVGDNRDLIAYATNIDYAQDSIAQYLSFGSRVLGVTDGMVVIEAKVLPDDYIVAKANTNIPPLVYRQEPEADLQGLQVVPFQVNSNLWKEDFYRKGGFGVRNPVAAAVCRVGNGAYAIPTNYNAATLLS